MALIVGHSHVKYFHHYLYDENIMSLSYSGSKIEELWEKIEDIVDDFKVIAVHSGANNIPGDDAETVLVKLEELCNRIHEVNPSCHVLLSGIPPRAQSGFDNNRKSEEFLRKFNDIADEVNETLARVTKTMERVSFVGFPDYVVNGEIQRHLLSKDGLHLSFEGTEYIVNTIENGIFRLMWDITKSSIQSDHSS